MNIINKAKEYAKLKHSGQKRRDGKEYFTHVEAVANIVNNEWYSLIPYEARSNWTAVKDHVVAAAYLHDVIEDCGVTKEDLINEGFSVLTAELVDALSRKKDESYFDFIMRIHNGDRPVYDSCGAFRVGMVAVKLADLSHNMNDGLKEGATMDKYRFAEYILSYFNKGKNDES